MTAKPRRRRRVAVLAALLIGAAGLAGAIAAGLRTRSAAPAAPPAAATVRTAPRPHLVRLRHVSGPHRAPVPILMYHVIAPPDASAPYPKLYVPPREFAEEVDWLAAHGYHAVTLQRVYEYWRDAIALPARPIVLSFDDGYHSVYSAAAPILRRRRWPGVLNLEVAHTRDDAGLRPRLVRALIAQGWELDAHTLTHPDLTAVGAAQLRREVAGSRALLRREFHVPVAFFCYPSGRYDDAVLAAVRAAGYLGATTTNPGLATPRDMFTLARVRVDGGDGAAGLAAKLAAAGA
jgi:peptidoglycan/xylan/chitin deacetylase (PgdA/CDA1 family)